MFRKLTYALVLLMLSAAAAPAQADKTDDFIKAEMQSQNVPGLSLAVVKDGQIIKAAGYGMANIKLKIPARPETVYRIASVSKQFIATGIMLLVQEGKIALDDPVARHLPAFRRPVPEVRRRPHGGALEVEGLLLEAAREIARTINGFGFGSNITVIYTVGQEVTMVLEELAGMASAIKKGIVPTQLYMTNMGGRFESHLREVKLEELFIDLGLPVDNVKESVETTTDEAGRFSIQMPGKFLRGRVIRAFDPTPGAYSSLRGNEVKLFGARVAPDVRGDPGVVLEIDEMGMLVACGTGGVRIAYAHPAGRRRLASLDWAQGRGVAQGDVFDQ